MTGHCLAVGLTDDRAQVRERLAAEDHFVILCAPAAVGRVERINRHQPAFVIRIEHDDATRLFDGAVG